MSIWCVRRIARSRAFRYAGGGFRRLGRRYTSTTHGNRSFSDACTDCGVQFNQMVKLSRNFVPFRGLAACALHLPRQAIALGGSRTEKHFRGNKKFCVWRPVLSWRNRADRRVARGVQALWDPRRKKVRKSCKSVDRARLRTETRIAGRGRREGF